MYEWCANHTALVKLIDVDLMDVALSMKQNGIEGKNTLEETDEKVKIRIQISIQDDTKSLPATIMHIDIPKLYGTLSDSVECFVSFRFGNGLQEYALILACFGDNLMELPNFPPLTLQLSEKIFPQTTVTRSLPSNIAEETPSGSEVESTTTQRLPQTEPLVRIIHTRILDARLKLYTVKQVKNIRSLPEVHFCSVERAFCP